MIEFILFKKKQLSLLYPNAKIIVTAPPFYNKTPNYQNKYILKLSQELEKRDIYFIAEQANSNKQIWINNGHLNKFGRKIRSK
jgi:abortive infection bacteriophage resistance protein